MDPTEAHTLSPWSIRAPLSGDPEDRAIMADGLLIAEVFQRSAANTYPDGKPLPTTANARLIAAAPELLEALETLCLYAGRGAGASELAFQTAKAAVAKAKGCLD